jgi:ABC-type sugar transport system ATPase subunit
VAGFIGSPAMNFAEMTAQDGALAGEALTVPLPARFRADAGGGRRFVAGFRPEHLTLAEIPDAATIRARAEVVEYLGNEELLHVIAEGGQNDIVAIVDSAYRVRPGDVIDLRLPLARLHLFDPDSGDAIAGSPA